MWPSLLSVTCEGKSLNLRGTPLFSWFYTLQLFHWLNWEALMFWVGCAGNYWVRFHMCEIKYMCKCLHIQGPNGNLSKMQSCILCSLTEEKCPWSQQALCWVRLWGIWPIHPAAPAVTLHVQELKYSTDAQSCKWGERGEVDQQFAMVVRNNSGTWLQNGTKYSIYSAA